MTTPMLEAPLTGRRVSPTGRLVLPATADRTVWLEARRRGVGSSDIAAILGLSTKGNELTVYHQKRGNLPLEGEDSEPAYWGRANEGTVAFRWTTANRTITQRVGLIANVDRPWQMCTLDRRVMECPLPERGNEKCALEVKCRSAFKASMWRRGCPDDVLAQTLHQMDVCGYDHLHVAVLIGGNDYRQFTVHRSEHEQTLLDLRAAAEDLWVNHVLAGRAPVLKGGEDPGPLIDLYRSLHPEREGVVYIDRDFEAQDALAEYLTAGRTESEAKKDKKVALAKLMAALGGARQAMCGDRPSYALDPTSREYCDVKRLAEEYPEAYSACVEDRPGERLYIPKSVREEHI